MSHAERIAEQLRVARDDDAIPEHIRERVQERLDELEAEEGDS